jgi:hypothetical protein
MAAMGTQRGETGSVGDTAANIAYILQMLGQLRQVAFQERADMLCYLIEMAYVEAGDLQAGRRSLSIDHRERH